MRHAGLRAARHHFLGDGQPAYEIALLQGNRGAFRQPELAAKRISRKHRPVGHLKQGVRMSDVRLWRDGDLAHVVEGSLAGAHPAPDIRQAIDEQGSQLF